MELKKNGDLVYAYIKKLSTQELIQFKRFLKFEHIKSQPYLNILNFATVFTPDWVYQDSFPEKQLKEKCDKEVIKNFAKYKHNLKQSIENYTSYIALSNQSETSVNFHYYKKAYFINYHYYYKLGLYKLAYQELRNLATEVYEVGHYDFSEILFRNMDFFTSYAFSNPSEAIAENKRIRKIQLENKQTVNYHTDILFYLQLFFNATKLPEDDLSIIEEDIIAFEKIVRDDSKMDIALNHLLAEVFVSTATNDFQRDLDANLKMVDLYNQHKGNLPNNIKKNKFSAIYNASLAARRLRNEKISKEMLQEAKLFLENYPTLDTKTRKHFYYFLLAGKVEHNIFFEKDSKLILESKNAVDEAVLKNEIELTPMQERSKNYSDILCLYITEKFESSYKLSYQHYTDDHFTLFSMLCHILSQYHLFDADFLSYSYRSIIRHIETKREYNKEEIELLKKLVSLLKKGKITKEDDIKQQILKILGVLKNDYYIFVHERIAEVFDRNFK